MVRHREPVCFCPSIVPLCSTMRVVPKKTYSGKLVVRLGPDLHAHLAAVAKEKDISLNSLITTLLAGSSSFKAPKK